MKLLLDECLPVDLRHSFSEHEAHTAQWAGFKGKKNGQLIRAAEAAGYDVLITVDQGIAYQQSIHNRSIAVLVIQCRTNQIQDLLPHVEAARKALLTIQGGQAVSVGGGITERDGV